MNSTATAPPDAPARTAPPRTATPFAGTSTGAPLAPVAHDDGLLGNLRAIRRGRLEFFTDLARRYGDVVRIAMPMRRSLHLVSSPDAVKHILQDNHRNYTKQTRGFDALRIFLGNGLLTSEGSFWLRQRRIAQPAFHRQRIAGFAETMVRETDRMLDAWGPLARANATVDVETEMMRLTLQIVGHTLLSTDVGSNAETIGNAVTLLLKDFNRRVLAPISIPHTWPTPANKRLRAAVATMDGLIYGIIRERRADPSREHNDLLDMMLRARDEETGESMSDTQLRDEVMTMIGAGHETTANALTWTLYQLAQNPICEARMRDEIAAVLGTRAPVMEDVAKLPYTKCVLQESMRLYPPAWTIGRSPTSDDVVGGYHVPAGGLVIFAPWVVHRHPSHWENPEGFDPERFTPERSEGRAPFAYFPFGGGPRQCIGNTFAMVESTLLLVRILQRTKLTLAPGHRVEPEPLVTLRPKYGMRMVLAEA